MHPCGVRHGHLLRDGVEGAVVARGEELDQPHGRHTGDGRQLTGRAEVGGDDHLDGAVRQRVAWVPDDGLHAVDRAHVVAPSGVRERDDGHGSPA